MTQPPRTPSTTHRTVALTLAWIALAAVVGFGVYLRFADTAPLPIDEAWAGIAGTQGAATQALAVFLARAGSALGVAALGAVAIALLLARRQRRDALILAVTLLAAVASSELLKALVARPRPLDHLYPATGSSYPSGHSMGAAALAVSLALIVAEHDRVSARVRTLAWCVAACWILLMMWSRAALHVHWLTDTIAGAMLGSAVAVIVRALWGARTHR